jgi:uncharacterized protein (TIGR03435 family)
VKLLLPTFLTAIALAAQTPVFEVASVRPGTSGLNGVRGGCHGIDSKFDPAEIVPPLGRCVIVDGRLSHLIGIAYGVIMSQIQGGPDWVRTGDDRFSIQAKADSPQTATEHDLLVMLQKLLDDRFQLRFHREDKLLPGFALVAAKNGPHLKPSSSANTSIGFGPAAKPKPGAPTTLTAHKATMAALAQALSRVSPGPVTDETGLTGSYDFTLSWDFEGASGLTTKNDALDSSGQSLFTAIRKQLGLRLEPRKVPFSYFVIESAQKPKEN